MDKNSAIGLTLIAAILLVYFVWFAERPQPTVPVQQPNIASESQRAASDSVDQEKVQADTALTGGYSEFSSTAPRNEALTTIETEDLMITLSNNGGIIKSLSLKHYTSYQDYKNGAKNNRNTDKPLNLVGPDRSTFNLLAKYKGQDIDLYSDKLFYQQSQRKNGDTTVVTFTANVGGGSVTHIYSIPAKGYEIGYSIKQKGLDQNLSSDNLTFQWNDIIKPLEKDLSDTRIYTTVTTYSSSEGFEELAERSTDTEIETFVQPLKWAAIKQKFFLSSIIAKNNFSGGEVQTSVPADTSIVKHASMKLFIAKSALSDGQEDFKFYIGPNDYQVIGKVTDSFVKNVYLGWPPVNWINKFVIFPVFHFLTQIISNYGLIIVVLVVLLKLVLAPLSYRSYLSMAKMKVLKPELDEIKAKHGDDMSKVQGEQLKLYQQVGVNPISGCVPVLLQMPILFAMFYLFPASIELRQQPFLWAEDLSTYDSIFRVPFDIPIVDWTHISLFTLLMTISTLVYTWQNNQLTSVTGPMKSMQYIMPVIFFFVLNSFSAGLTFYYFVSNVVTFAQQAIIRRFVDDNKIKLILEENRKKNITGSGKKSKFMTKLQEAMKASEEAKRRAEEDRKRKK
jgi:YidC/Oxa1 family membrane protein insertase